MPEAPEKNPQEISPVQGAGDKSAVRANRPPNAEEDNLLRQVADIESESKLVPADETTPVQNPSGPIVSKPKSKKKLVVILAAVILMVFGASGTAFALWFNHPDTATSDALKNLIASKTMINDGTYNYHDTKTKFGMDLTFKSQSDVPAYAGSIDVDAKINYQSFSINTKGSAMMSESGAIYFKLQNVNELISQALETEYGKLYVNTPELKAAVKKFVAKIDNQWVKLSQSDLALFAGGSGDLRTCYKKAFAGFYENDSQQSQIVDAYNQNRFIVFKETGDNQTIGGQDSISYKVGYDVKVADGFGVTLKKTDIAKALERCSDEGKKQSPYIGEQSAKEKQKQLEREQKEADKTQTTLWISRWSHQLTKVETASNLNASTTKFNATFKPNEPLQLSDPKKFITLEQLQAELNDVFQQAQPAFAGSSDPTLP